MKGTIEAAETIQQAAERELLEESGIVGTAIGSFAAVQMTEPDQEWHLSFAELDGWPKRRRTERAMAKVSV